MHGDKSVLEVEISPKGDTVKPSSKESSGEVGKSLRLVLWTSSASAHLIPQPVATVIGEISASHPIPESRDGDRRFPG